MKERSGMPYDVVAYEADEAAMLLTPEQEGIFHRLLRRAWMNGSIPDDEIKLASICRVTKLQMHRAWPAIRPLWYESPTETGRLLNAKQESEREWTRGYSTRQAERGSLGGKAKALRNKEHSVASAKQAPSKRSSLPHPSPSPSPFNTNTNTEDGELRSRPPAARRTDNAYQIFADEHLQKTGAAYLNSRGDFVQLARLRKANSLGSEDTPDGWQIAAVNYFESPISKPTMADLCTRFAVFKISPVDSYGKPILRSNGEPYELSKSEQRDRRIIAQAQAMGAELFNGFEVDVQNRNEPGDVRVVRRSLTPGKPRGS